MADHVYVEKIDKSKKNRYHEIEKRFIDKYGKLPSFYARAPGRVNLIGEHIDYCGYAVLPMALEQDIIIAVADNNVGKINLCNFDLQYPPFSVDVDAIEIDQNQPQWYHYFLCGYRGIAEQIGTSKLLGMDVLLCGSIPRSAGLSSSSALVCASGLATMHLNKKSFSRLELADICTKCERYIGTIGGGMDQSISFLAESGTAKLIEFNPLKATDVTLPTGVAFVVSNSCVELNKAATSQFNTRVVECRLAAQVIAKTKGFPWKELKRLVDVQKSAGLSLSDMVLLVNDVLHKEPYTKEEVCKILEVTADELNGLSLSHNTLHVDKFELHKRAKHVYSEARRVLQFKEICDDNRSNAIQQLGQLMNESHASCRDLYECSCTELDSLVQICQNSGAAGARLTGAGWGGCAVSLVSVDKVDEFMKAVSTCYYQSTDLLRSQEKVALFSTQPGAGAALYSAF
ncbi:N-acetylgalactosamine kinase-like [Tubulanus polymorphus]|uniref:N-acetylgalactosamine kinase-like n=1 Tax=Tubulanus polymorphus TaxID=672921 RepID=UPI003DA3D8F0